MTLTTERPFYDKSHLLCYSRHLYRPNLYDVLIFIIPNFDFRDDKNSRNVPIPFWWYSPVGSYKKAFKKGMTRTKVAILILLPTLRPGENIQDSNQSFERSMFEIVLNVYWMCYGDNTSKGDNSSLQDAYSVFKWMAFTSIFVPRLLNN